MAITQHTKNFVLGKGRAYFAIKDPDTGKYGGDIYLGDSQSVSLSVDQETVEIFDSDGRLKVRAANVPISVAHKLAFTCRDVQPEVLALFIAGVTSEESQGAGSVTDESVGEGVALVGDREYQLGRSTAMPSGARNLSNVVIKSNAGATTHVLGTDYELDATLGRIKVIEGSSLDGTVSVTADYDTAAKTFDRVTSSDAQVVRGRFTFIADNALGTNRSLVAPNCDLKAGGEFALKSGDGSTPQEMSFEGSPVVVSPLEAVYIDDTPV